MLCSAGKTCAHILSGEDYEELDGSGHIYIGPLNFLQTDTQHQAQSPEKQHW